MHSAPPADDTPDTARPTAAPLRPAPRSLHPKLIPGGMLSTVVFGILLPICALCFELSTGMARDIIDPIPTVAHAVAIGFVPFAHFAALLALRAFRFRPSLRLAAHFNSAACAIALVYALLFLPITPFAFIAILMIGLGLLALSPLSSFLVAIRLRTALRRHAAELGERLPPFLPGFAAGILALALLEAPSFLTEHFVQQLQRSTPAEQSVALSRLRLMAAFGGENQLLRGSYGFPRGGLVSGKAGSGFAFFDSPPADASEQEAFRLAYYRVTGRAFNSVPAPRHSTLARGRANVDDSREWVWDDNLGTQQVGRRLRSLALTESRLDARLDGDATLGYLEWTLVFRNDHAFDQREARALIQLPPGAAVSRLTLWVHGEEREAAWGGPAKVVQAYRSVAVAQRRDPVLVTAQGPDRVLMQCFPIEPRGGLMKVRLGITLPLALSADAERAHLLLPRFIEQNFSVADSTSHQLWVDADAPLTPDIASLQAEGSLARPALRGTLSPADLAHGLAPLSIARSPASAFAWTPALRDPSRVVTQTLRREPPPADDVALLISGSSELAPAARALSAALRQAQPTPFVRLHHSGDEAAESPLGLDAAAQARWLDSRRFAGGQDDTEALATALDALAARGGGTLIWVHGGQPLSWQNAAALEQRLARRGKLVRIVSVPALAAPNVLLEKVAATAAPLTTFARIGDLDTDLARLVRELREGRLVAERSSRSAAGFPSLGKRASDHLSRLWARDEVHRLLATGDLSARESAQALALAAQIVTPVSGAVVLETDAQYKANGLEASDAKNSPVVPEPATYGLLMSGALLVFTLFRRRPRRHSTPTPALAPAAIPASA